MSKQELKILRRKLQEKLNELNQGSGQTRLLAGERSADMVGDAQAGVAVDLAVHVLNNDWYVKHAVETALERMDGDYGIQFDNPDGLARAIQAFTKVASPA